MSKTIPSIHQYLLLPNGESRIQVLKNLALSEDKKRKEMPSPAPVNIDKKRIKTSQTQEKNRVLKSQQEEEQEECITPDIFSISSQQHPFDKKVVSLKQKLDSKKTLTFKFSEQNEKDLDNIQVTEQQRENFDQILSQRINLQANVQDGEEDFDLGL